MSGAEPAVLYADDSVMLVDKPAGRLTVPTPKKEARTLLAWASEWARDHGARKAYVVHRLDRETSGVLALALTAQARQALEEQFRAHKPGRLYMALVEGVPRRPEATLKDRLVSDPRRPGVEVVSRNPNLGVEAITVYETDERFGERAALLRVTPRTGRTNQIRVQLAHAGHPIIGDRKYSKAAHWPVRAKRTLLHAAMLEIRHPSGGEPLRAESPLPADFEAAIAELRRQDAAR